MSKFLAVCCTLLLHFAFVTGFVETGAAATQIAADRATQTSIG